jgi:two-component system chemotaxis response regulator CheB
VLSTVRSSTSQTPNPPLEVGLIVIASSAGGIVALGDLLSVLPRDFPIPIVVAQHLCPSFRYRSVLNEVLLSNTRLGVKWAEEGEWLLPGTVYLAPQDHHTMIQGGGRIHLSRGEKINSFQPSADPLFASAVQEYGAGTVGVVLSGSLSDGSQGAALVKAAGGQVFAQSPESCAHASMPEAAMRRCHLEQGFSPQELGNILLSLV